MHPDCLRRVGTKIYVMDERKISKADLLDGGLKQTEKIRLRFAQPCPVDELLYDFEV